MLYCIYVCVPHFYDLSALVCCWSSVYIRRSIYKSLNVWPFDYTAVAVSGKVELSLTGFGDCCYSNWPSSVGPQSLCNQSFGGVFVLSRCFLDVSVGVGAFVIGLSQISSLFSYIQLSREKGRDLSQSYDKSPYTYRNVKRAKWQHKQRHKKVRLNSGCGPT